MTAENTGISDENKKISDENGILSENNKKLSDEKTALEADCRLKNLSVEALNKDCSAVKQTVDKYSNIAEKLFCSKGKTGWKYAVRCAVKKGLFAAGANVKAIRKIRKSGGFDVLYYCEKNRDVLEKGMDPLVHFIWFGGYEGRNPSSKFNASKYLSSYDDVRKSGINPYVHYLLYGEKEHRNPFAKKTSSAPIKNILPASDKKAFVKETIVADEPKDIKADLIAENSRALRKKDISVNGNPLVSIIIINHNGLKNLKTLFTSFREKDFYSNFEIIFVDNASTDNSIEYVKSLKEYKTTIIRNSVNESFSKANNQGIQAASGEYVLFLNNDLEVTDFWLDCLIHTAQQNADCGAVGSRLVYPYIPKDFINHNKSFKIQHMGIVYENSAFEDRHFIRPVNYKNGCEPFLSNLGGDEPYEISGVTAACMLVKKSVIEAVGGFDEEYVYGYEDCDLNLEIYRKGYKNYLCPCSLLFHYEFGTQNNSSREEIVKRRTNNIHHFMSKWQGYIRNMMWKDKLSDTSFFIGSDNPLTVAVVVTDDDPGTSAGDYFTGMELCTALQRRGCRTKFLALKKDNCYDVGQETDVLISLLEKFDLNQMYNYSPMLVTIAWARNWFDRWCKLPYINNFTYIFASSVTACDYMKNILNRDIELFPIATNDRRFNNYNVDRDNKSPFYSDYVFTGSYWGAPREIIDIIEPSEIPFDFKIFGANWDKIPKFRKHYKGFVNYVEMPDIYRNTRIVVDDANHVTKPYGAVNSRVFDALAAGRLVVTNGTIGAKETFEGLLPSFETKEEFEALINKYLSDQDAYNKRVNELREFVLKNHTYDIRAKQLIEFLKKKLFPNEKKLALMIPVPKYEEAESWGDYHFAVAMKKQFERKGFTAEIRILPEWDMPFDGKYVIVLRGLSIYEPKKQHLNIMWNISHPDDIPLSEYEKYDKVYVSSEKWTEHLKMQLRTDVETLMQCTDEEVFCPPVKNEHKHQLLFVGNSRKVFRKIIKDLLPTPYSLSVYGTNWEKYIDSAYIKGKNIPNKELSAEYGSCDILLNDHWDDMREKGFVSNRIYDGLASGAFIITDEIDGMDDELNKCVAFYKDRNDLAEKVKY
ncbi:MAG: glycosyltransferase, partial [Ruminiclostridium sp.]